MSKFALNHCVVASPRGAWNTNKDNEQPDVLCQTSSCRVFAKQKQGFVAITIGIKRAVAPPPGAKNRNKDNISIQAGFI